MNKLELEDEKERERIRKRREELGDDEISRREKIYDQAQAICGTLVHHPNAQEVEPLLLLAEELRERLQLWIWPE